MNKTISFDFDFTLSRPEIQDYARDLILRGYELWIITSRPSDGSVDNTELLEVAGSLGIPNNRVVFTGLKPKYIPILELKPILHLDDDPYELDEINRNTHTVGISCWRNTSWRKKCEKLLMEK